MSTRSTQYTEIGVDNIKTLFGTKEYRLYMTKSFGIEWEICRKAESTLKNVFKEGFRVRFLRDNTKDIIGLHRFAFAGPADGQAFPLFKVGKVQGEVRRVQEEVEETEENGPELGGVL